MDRQNNRNSQSPSQRKQNASESSPKSREPIIPSHSPKSSGNKYEDLTNDNDNETEQRQSRSNVVGGGASRSKQSSLGRESSTSSRIRKQPGQGQIRQDRGGLKQASSWQKESCGHESNSPENGLFSKRRSKQTPSINAGEAGDDTESNNLSRSATHESEHLPEKSMNLHAKSGITDQVTQRESGNFLGRTESAKGGDNNGIFQSKQYDNILFKTNSQEVNEYYGAEASQGQSDNLNRINPSVDPNMTKQQHENLIKVRNSTLKHITSVEDEIMQNYKDKITHNSNDKANARQSNQMYEGHQTEESQRFVDRQSIEGYMSSNDGQGNFCQRVAGENFQQMITHSHSKTDEEIMPGSHIKDLTAQRIFKFINDENHKGLIQMLMLSNQQYDLTIMKDTLNFTLLSYCAYLNDANAFKIIFEYVWKRTIPNEKQITKEQEQKIRDWVNLQTNENFTALHYVAQHGNYTMLTLLVEKAGADLNIRNKFGASVMHMAAQKDQALSLYYFSQRGVDINVQDMKKCTPLHWACFKGSEMALIYILSLKPNLEAKDIRGLTPLHIAVNSVGKLGSTRCVKTLLISGSDREAQDNDGKTPHDWIQDDQTDSVKAELDKHLGKQSYCECLLLRIPLTPLKRNHKTQALFVALFATVYMLSLFIIQPKLSKYGIGILLTSTISTMLVFLTFFYASCKDPGAIMPEKSTSFLQLLRDINPADLCPECKVIKTARSRHCSICNQCVERFDHHCPWINNCVGIKNHNAFMLFVFAIWVKIVIHAALNVFSMANIIEDGFDGCKSVLCEETCLFTMCHIPEIYITSWVICMLICFFYFLLSSLLLYTHVKNYLANRTTSERLASNRKSRQRTQSQASSSNTDTSNLSSSVMSYSDFEDSKSMMLDQTQEVSKMPATERKKSSKGCCINIWKMSTHTKIVPQERLYKYLADRSIEIEDGQLEFSKTNDNSK